MGGSTSAPIAAKLRRAFERTFALAVRRYPVVGSNEANLFRVIRDLEIDSVIDVGAHHGEFARSVRKDVRFTGSIFSFEPSPEAFRTLQIAAEDDAMWSTYPFALSHEDGEERFIFYSDSHFNSLYNLNESGRTRFSAAVVESGMAQVRRLDGIDLQIGRSILLKSDTQGNDLKVLEGARGVLDRVRAVQIEAGVRPIYDHAPSLSEVVNELDEMGFGPVSFSPVTRRASSLAAIEFDVLFVRVK